MKREDVKNKIPGITEEQLNWLMQENGSDITREKFLSTLSLRRATLTTVLHWYHISRFLSTLSLRRATRSGGPWQAGCRDFYPRSPCGERPCSASRYFSMPSYFYPRSPCGERPREQNPPPRKDTISIHALLAESDQPLW